MKRLAVIALGAIAACSAPEPPSTGEQYLELQRLATEEVGAWGLQEGAEAPDPRPVWAGRLEEFARAHPEAPEAAEALGGAMRLRASRQNASAFFSDYELLLRIGPDSMPLASSFEEVVAMRMVEEGGYGIVSAQDLAARRQARSRASARIVEDLERALDATNNPMTRAAAHYAIGLNYHEIGIEPDKALERFYIVMAEYPDSPLVESARRLAAEIEDMGVGRPAPDFQAQTLGGRTVSLSSFEGKILLLNFWTTECESCSLQLPELRRAQWSFRYSGFRILGINLDREPEAAARFMSENAIPWGTTASGMEFRDPVAIAYRVQSLPMSYLIGPDGTIQGRALWGGEVAPAVSRLVQR